MQDLPPPAIVNTAPDLPPGFGVDPDRVINILVPQPCEPSSSDEIVVCGQREGDRHRLEPLRPLPPQPTLMQRIADALTVRLGPIEIAPAGPNSNIVGITIRVRSEDE